MDFQTDEFFIFHNDPECVLEFMDDNAIYIGFNSKAYDQYIMKAVCGGCEPDEIKELNDFLIEGHNGWEHPLMQQIRYWFNKATFSSELCEKLLSIYAKPGSVVYDPFMGSGTTAVACMKMGFDCIGSEISAAHCEYARNRLVENRSSWLDALLTLDP